MDSVASESLPSGLVTLDADDRFVDANRVMLDWLGAEIVDVVGRQFSDVVIPPSSNDADAEYFVGLSEVVGSDGSRLPVFLAEGPRDDAGRRQVTVFDATSQREFRVGLRKRHGLVERTQKRLELVIAASIAFAETTSEAELAEVLAATT